MSTAAASGRSRWLRLPGSRPGRVAVWLVIWYVATMSVWGVRPLTDHVPIVSEGEEEEVEQSSQAVSCHAPWTGDGSVRGDLPGLSPGWSYERPACQGAIRGAWRLVVLNTVVLTAGVAGLGYWQVRRRSARSAATEVEVGVG